MARIFLVLALLATVLLIATFVLGLQIGDYHAAVLELAETRQRLDESDQATSTGSHELHPDMQASLDRLLPIRDRASWHKNMALLTSLVVLLVNSVALTYFIGTNRWCKEVTATYQLSSYRLIAATQLKRQTYAWALAGIVAILIVVILGAAADPAAGRSLATERGSQAAQYHYVGAMIATGVIAWAFLAEAYNIHRNTKLVEEIMEEVQRIRRDKGLPV
ncbi:MAG: hypothetical protein U0795_10020 [Pirellulales bacterium]